MGVRTRRPLAGVVVAGMVVVAACLGVLTWRWFLQPQQDQIDQVDALLLFDGGSGERIESAYRLAQSGRVGHVVLVVGVGQAASEGQPCGDWPAQVVVHCLNRNGVVNTRSEAAVMAQHAQSQGWDTVVVVTSTYHLGRARLLTQRCFDGEVLGMGGTPDISPPRWFGRIIHEWGGRVRSWVQRGC